MDKWIDVTIRDNDNKDFAFVYSAKISQTDFATLNDYDSENYEEVWDRLCNRIEKVMPSHVNWYIDGISEHKKGDL